MLNVIILSFIKKRKLIIAIDFDGTICKNNYPKIGKPNHFLIYKLKLLKKLGHTLILWTCRNNDMLDEALDFCTYHDLYFDYVNENSNDILRKYDYVDSRKITADVYIDDRARSRL